MALPKWYKSNSSKSVFIISQSKHESASLANSKSLSPFSINETNANVVLCPSNLNIKLVFILFLLNVSSKKSPNASFPTVPQKYASTPNLLIAAATFAGAPPAFLTNVPVFFIFLPISEETKSINASPGQITFFIISPNPPKILFIIYYFIYI